MTAIASVLEGYPEDVVRRVTAPRTGITGKSKFLPSVAEIKSACDDEMAPLHRQWERERRDNEALLAIPGPRAERPTIEKLRELTGRPDLGMGRPREKAAGPPIKSEAELRAEYQSITVEASPALLELLKGEGE